ncbi:hypothetical protein [Arthrobacter bambusae]|uniref:hypothetical protein n=1 Tax=Arthrobacter bambusae TaxID=1338426 RepID=UPI0027813384|nr:hypothetical protein [Arthrobacter bambusae]MDQ0213123.1 hypothetical protein [Arthrobacter bambusae]MDQ0237427.1 hypothetical protein [Arthrobacter bambusae]
MTVPSVVVVNQESPALFTVTWVTELPDPVWEVNPAPSQVTGIAALIVLACVVVVVVARAGVAAPTATAATKSTAALSPAKDFLNMVSCLSVHQSGDPDTSEPEVSAAVAKECCCLSKRVDNAGQLKIAVHTALTIRDSALAVRLLFNTLAAWWHPADSAAFAVQADLARRWFVNLLYSKTRQDLWL